MSQQNQSGTVRIPKSLQCCFGEGVPAPYVYIDAAKKERQCCGNHYQSLLKAEYDSIRTEDRIASIEKAKKERLEKLQSE